jgi:CHAT domain-containing protein/Tfp pilus assembly protein PilF
MLRQNKLTRMALLLVLLGGQSPVLAQHNASTPSFPSPSNATPSSERTNSLERAFVLNQQALGLLDQGRYGEAEPLLLESLSIRREQLGDNHPDVATSLNNLSAVYWFQGRYGEAEPLLLEALAIKREQVGDNHPDVAISLNNLASLYENQGRYDEAEPRHLEALAIRREQLGDNHPDVANSLNNLAHLYRTQGRYNEAEPLFLEALAIEREQLGDNHPEVATTLNNLAGLYRLQGRYGEAEPRFLESLTILREQLGDNHPDVATTLNNLAILYQDQGHYSEAEPLFLEALAIRREQLPDNHPDVATSLANLATIYRFQGRYGEAEPLYLESLEINRRQLGDNHPEVAISLGNLATLYRFQGRYGEAESLNLESLTIFREQLDENHPHVAVSLDILARLYWAQRKWTQAIATRQAGLAIEEFHLSLNLATLAEAQRQDYAATLRDSNDLTLSLHLQGAAESPEAAAMALTSLLRRKGRVLDAGVDSLQRLRQNLSPSDQQRLDALTRLRQQLAGLIFNPSVNLNRAEIDRLETEINQREAELARRSAVFKAEAQPANIPDITAQLPDDGVLVEYVRYRPFNPTDAQNQWGAERYAAYLLFSDGDIEAVDLGDAADIDAAVQAFSLGLRDITQSPSASARALSAQILDPIQPYLTEREHLLISPDSQLNRIPFEALRTAENRYLVQDYQISYLNSGRDLLKFDVTVPSKRPAVIVANPDYEVANASIQIASTRSSQRSAELSQLQFGPLPGTAAEAEAIQQYLPNAEVLTADQATENALKQTEAPRILHIATHGFFLANVDRPEGNDSRGLGVIAADNAPNNAPQVTIENPLLRSGLALAGFNPRSSGSEDGVLTALEASTLNLFGTQLVVLSACDTGLGDIANDTGTSELMADYYEQLLSGKGRAEALRDVQLDMINSGNRYAHPYYWAAFITTGNWRPLQGQL